MDADGELDGFDGEQNDIELEERLEDMTSVINILALWEKSYESRDFYPVPILNRLSEVLESEYEMYMKLDPDPFDDRHPIRTRPSCPYGHSLKQIFKKEVFVSRVVMEYMRENWGEHDLEVNTAACRLFINILPGLETAMVYQETEGLLTRLFTWAERALEPLQSYSLGVLGASMEVPDIASKFKDKNAQLVPQMLRRLKQLQDSMFDASVPRPFAHLNKSKSNGFNNSYENRVSSHYQCLPDLPAKLKLPSKRRHDEIDNDSSSSWAEMESNIIGLMSIYPVDLTSRQIFTLRYLAPLGEYQEMLTYTLSPESISIILFNLQNGNSRLQFETLKYLASLLCHKKFTSEFLTESNLRLLLSIPRPSISATGLSLVLYYIVYEPDSIVKLNQFDPQLLKALVSYVNWLLECSHTSSRNHALMFYASTYTYKFILDLFDLTDGLRRVLNIASTSLANIESDEELEANIKKQSIKQVCINLKKYFESEETHKVRKLSHAIEKFLRLNGVKLLLNILDLDTNSQTLINVFDTLTIICHHGKAQMQITDKSSLILSAVEGELLNDPEVQKSSLRLLSKLLRGDSKNLETIQEAVRLNNGLLVLTRLLFTKVPVTDADAIRTLASDCLVGLTRENRQIQQILNNLSIVQNGSLKLLGNEPILEQSTDHLRFKANIEKLTTANTLALPTVIKYDKSELLELIRQYLRSQGLSHSAEVLKQEGKLNDSSQKFANDISLDSIVTNYLQGQHAKCENPMSIVPKVSLGQVHKCPSVINKGTTKNYVRRLFDFRTKNYPRALQDHRLVYSKFKPVRSFRLETQDDFYSSCSFSSPINQWLLAGTQAGEVKLYNLANGEEEATYVTHESEVYHLQLNTSNSLLLTSSIWRKPLSSLWRMDTPVIQKITDFANEEYIELSKLNQNLIISTSMDKCYVYDIETNTRIGSFFSDQSNQYTKNRATFSVDDKLILNDGVLYDYIGNRSIYKFDKLNDHINGIFHENDLEIISNSNVWDIRTFRLLKSVKLLDSKSITFADKVMYGLKMDTGDSFDSCFVTLDSSDYSSISTIELKKPLVSLCSSWNYLQIGIVERYEEDSCLRVYDVGRVKDEEDKEEEETDDEDEMEGDEDDEGGDDDDDDGDEIAELIEQLGDDLGDSENSSTGSDDDDNDDNDSDDDDDDGTASTEDGFLDSENDVE